jgi:hypothetical protein
MRKPHEKFNGLASHLVRVSNAEVDERERQWLTSRSSSRSDRDDA